VIVMSARPGRVAARYDTSLPAGASRRELLRLPEFTELRDELLARLEEAS
jgi:ABC-type taurine transport system ATPase subunit